jgi:hypothetical protein
MSKTLNRQIIKEDVQLVNMGKKKKPQHQMLLGKWELK